MKSGYFQVELDEESSYLTTFLLPSGRFRYVRAPMGLCISSDCFLSKTDAALRGLTGVVKLVDDLLVVAPTLDLLIERCHALLQRCREHQIILSSWE